MILMIALVHAANGAGEWLQESGTENCSRQFGGIANNGFYFL
jgi:hypothetical protein